MEYAKKDPKIDKFLTFKAELNEINNQSNMINSSRD